MKFALQATPLAWARPQWLSRDHPWDVRNGHACLRQARAHASVSDARIPATPVAQTVKALYEAYNRSDVSSLLEHFADDVVYHDTQYLDPFFGKLAVRSAKEKMLAAQNGMDVTFVVTEYAGDATSCAVAWHLEVDGAVLPFSRRCTFYKCDGAGKIVWVRDCLEAAPLKPGDAMLDPGMELIVPLFRRLGVNNMDPAKLAAAPIASAAVWALYAGYVVWVLLGTAAPGNPAWQTSPAALAEIWHESLNFFYVNVGLDALGVPLVPSVPEHPVSEALFNFVGAWSMMFLPVMLKDRQTQKVDNVIARWIAIMLLTNITFIPYLALRAAPDPHPSGLSPSERTLASLSSANASAAHSRTSGDPNQPPPAASSSNDGGNPHPALPDWATRAFGALALFIGGMSFAWAFLARPEYGDIGSRLAFFSQAYSGDRVFYAFVLDAGLYSLWQAMMLNDAGAPRRYCAVPFLGHAMWLLEGCPRKWP